MIYFFLFIVFVIPLIALKKKKKKGQAQVSIFLFQKGFFSGQEKEELYLKNLVLQFFVITKKRMCSISITKKVKQRRETKKYVQSIGSFLSSR